MTRNPPQIQLRATLLIAMVSLTLLAISYEGRQIQFLQLFSSLPSRSVMDNLDSAGGDGRRTGVEPSLLGKMEITNSSLVSSCPQNSKEEIKFIDCKGMIGDRMMGLRDCLELKDVDTMTIVPIEKHSDGAMVARDPNVIWHARDLPEIESRARAIGQNLTLVEKARDETRSRTFLRGIVGGALPAVAVVRNAHASMSHHRVQTCGTQIQFDMCGGTDAAVRIPTDQVHHSFERAIYLSSPWMNNVFHATVEGFPRLAMIRDLVRAEPDLPIVIARPEAGHFRTLAEQILDIPSTRFVVVHPKAVIFAKVLLVPEPTPCGRLQPPKAEIARSLIAQKVPPSPKDILLIRRTKYGIVNHDVLEKALVRALPDENVVVFDDADLPPAGIPQFRLFAEAKVIVGPHGAGLANLLAAPRSSSVVEFMGARKRFNYCFLYLSVALGLEYHPLVMRQNSKNEYFVDVPHMVNVVREILERQNDREITSSRRY